jgi:hypothetical protein
MPTDIGSVHQPKDSESVEDTKYMFLIAEAGLYNKSS